MKYDAFDGHDVVNKDLRKLMETEGLDVQLSYNGLCVPNALGEADIFTSLRSLQCPKDE
ncbi:hypothetical protein SAY86_029604 [Trapa natans]|uniref:Uncharacterized protein n=1 Tax=Trapa natans TaxID=22666 RepID=A0AAN7LWN7_TRANT|nr:hypothetical protein SAY86_029604 [Trapa natans]